MYQHDTSKIPPDLIRITITQLVVVKRILILKFKKFLNLFLLFIFLKEGIHSMVNQNR